MYSISRRCITLAKKCFNIPFRPDEDKINPFIVQMLLYSSGCNPQSLIMAKKQKVEDKQKLEKLLEDPQKLAMYKKLQLEIESMRHMGARVPETLSDFDWLMLLGTTTRSQTRSYLAHRFIVEKREEQKVREKANKEIKQKTPISEYEKIAIYGLFHNTMFVRLQSQNTSTYFNTKLAESILFEPKVIFDMSFDEYMTNHEILNLVKQLVMTIGDNKKHITPLDIELCNVNPNSLLMKQLEKRMPNIYQKDSPVTVTETSYLSTHPKDELIYLSPDARHTLQRLDPRYKYIIGGIVDKSGPKKLTIQKARVEGIKSARLPLNEYLDWGAGSGKNLPLNHVFNIIADANHLNDWKRALEKNIPSRKLSANRLKQMENRVQKRQERLNALMQNMKF